MFNLDLPLDVNWELNNKCNLMCPQCGRNEIKDGVLQWRKAGTGDIGKNSLNTVDNSLDTFRKVYNNIGFPVRTIRFQGHLSENILSKDFLPICKFIREETNTSIQLSTHGSSNTTEWWTELAEVFQGYGGNIVYFSLDGVGDESLGNYRVGASFKKVIENAQAFIDAGGKAYWRMIIFKHNQHQIEEAQALAESMGFHEFMAVYTPRQRSLNESWTYKGKSQILKSQDISPEWNEAIEKNVKNRRKELVDIECKAIKENQFYIDYNNKVWACYYLPNMVHLAKESDWYSDYYQDDSNNLLDKSLEEILKDKFYGSLTMSWHTANNCLSMCKKQCSKKVGLNRGLIWGNRYRQEKHMKDYTGGVIQDGFKIAGKVKGFRTQITPTSTIQNFDEFKTLWEEQRANIPIKKKFANLGFIIVYPGKPNHRRYRRYKLEWDFGVEKQVQTICLQTSGGITGAGTGHNQVLCYQSELHDVLTNCEFSHVMIVSVGMVFDMTVNSTAIESFYEFAESEEFCKAHIIAHPAEAAYLHHQHIELYVDMWKTVGCPDLFEKRTDYKRSKENYHDDYTPHWIQFQNFPTITNFDKRDRKGKAFSYDRKEMQNKMWGIIDSKVMNWREAIEQDDNYFKIFCTRLYQSYYAVNNEELHFKLTDEPIDLIFSPTSGYSTEYFVEKLNFDGEIVFYDYCSENVDAKRAIVEMNMSLEEQKILSRRTHHIFDFSSESNHFPDIEESRRYQEKMYENYNIEYWQMNLLTPNYNKLREKIEGRNVFFNASNIFGYHMTHACYTLGTIVEAYEKLREILNLAETHIWRGTTPTKKWVK